MTSGPLLPQDTSLDTVFGPLERRVLEALWARRSDACVRDLQPGFRAVAYTTLMTTLDRLYRKGVLDRVKTGRAFRYRPRLTKAELQSQLTGSVLATLLPGKPADARPILSMFVDVVSDRDGALLEELEALVRTRRDERSRQEHG